jgi:dihydrofolate synthase/folylpolyglutamate synthase
MTLARVEEVLAWRWPETKIEPSLARISHLATLLGDPHLAYPVIHVTGTNGKTSTSRMIEALLRDMGLRTGLVTSPHLHHITERIRLDGDPISEERFVEAYDEIEPYLAIVDEASTAAGGPAMSYFEVVTGLAFAVFADAPVDVAVIEVGLGGQWDATNIVWPAVCVVTPIGMDHMDYLGDSLRDIAVAKAGIIKPDSVVVLARQEPVPAEVLLTRAVEVGATVAREGMEFGVVARDVAVGGQSLSLRGLQGQYDEVFLGLYGQHQADNAAVALAAVEAFVGDVPLDAVQSAFASVTSPGRLEVVRRNPTVLVDAAHNPHGATVLASALAESFTFEYIVGVVSVMADKDVAGVLAAFQGVFDEVVVTWNGSDRAMRVDDIYALAVHEFGVERVHRASDMASAIDTAIARADEHGQAGVGVVLTGSVVTAAVGRALLGKGRA